MDKNKTKNFLVSTADFAFYVNDVLACTGTTNLNSSIEVSMDEQDVQGGKGNKILFSYKYNRQLNVTLEAADWRLEYISMNTGSKIAEGLTDVYKIGECIDINEGVGTLSSVPIGDVAINLGGDNIITVSPEGSTIDISRFGITSGTVKATYRYNTVARQLTIDSETVPMIGKLILDADKYNQKSGKVGSVQVIVPSYQLNGNFTIDFTPDGVTSTSMEGKALAVESDKCSDGSAIYAYVKEFNQDASALVVNEIAATPAKASLSVGDTTKISVIGMKGVMYSTIELENTSCTFTSNDADKATVDVDGVITAVAAGTTTINVSYGKLTDTIEVTVA